ALVVQPKVILADEPTGNLDSTTARQIMNILKKLNQKNGITIILVTHEKEVAAYGSRLIQMKDGVVQTDEIIGA
ncbi:MAG: macrolide ABC transporter ATP-binding protein, partial [Burkholderiaceae bacterium]